MDFMLQQLRQYTESPGTVVLASIAGGRKTMSALLFSDSIENATFAHQAEVLV